MSGRTRATALCDWHVSATRKSGKIGVEALLVIGQLPFLLSVFILLEVWYFVYTNLCPFLHRISYFRQLNPSKACLRIGYHLLPLAKFLALPDDEHVLNEREVLAEAAAAEAEESSADELELSNSDDEESVELELDGKDIDDGGVGLIKLHGRKYNGVVDIDTLDDQFNFKVNIYKSLPLNALSRLWGKANNVDVPVSLRQPMYRLYAWLFHCNLSEALVEDLTFYQNLGQFFRREIKPHVRPVSPQSIVSPCDGRILHFGKVENSLLEQVKGVTYSLKTFLGPNTWNGKGKQVDDVNEVSDEDYHKSLGIKPGNSLFHCVIYLAPGDYHRFHSPVNWKIQHRRHFPGCLLSVNPGIARWVQGLFSLNERVVLYGDWEHGFFSYTAVGATNVGSISIYFDQELTTNVRGSHKQDSYQDSSFKSSTTTTDSANKAATSSTGVKVTKGNCIGEFNLGSTIVMVFEAPEDFEFNKSPGDRVQLGEQMGSL